MRTVRIAQFEGPLDLLLQLIEEQELDITELSLAAVTEQYLRSLRAHAAIPAEELADFLVVAAKLLLLKSRTLLPNLVADEAEEGPTLEQQLRLYRRFVEAARFIDRRYVRGQRLFARESTAHFAPMFLPPERIGAGDLRALFLDILKRIEPIVLLPKESLIRAVSLQVKIAEIERLAARADQINFHDLLARSKNRLEIIVTFLALLELIKRRSVSVVQEASFRDMTIHRSESRSGPTPGTL